MIKIIGGIKSLIENITKKDAPKDIQPKYTQTVYITKKRIEYINEDNRKPSLGFSI